MYLFAIVFAVTATLPVVLSWGAAGHEMVATIAQIHLYPSTKEKLCQILPEEAKCHLAPVAAWADRVRNKYRGTAPMHYINAKKDHPHDHCEFGEDGWMNEDVNVVTAIQNFTQTIMDGKGGRDVDIALRFLVHLIGDLHQPLHLTGRDKGGNKGKFFCLLSNEWRSLHSVWDSGIITKNIRELSNYTSPLPSKQIESALPGSIFDPYVRWIVWEGVRLWWKDDISTWLSCPDDGDPFPHSSQMPIPPSASLILKKYLRSASSFALSLLPSQLSTVAELSFALPLKETEGLENQALVLTPQKLSANGAKMEFPTCPYAWATFIHQLNCDIIWPASYTGNAGEALIELDTAEYLGEIGKQKIVEKMLAMAGLRLAKVLNHVLAGEDALYFGY
nr:nuclease I [Cryptococcus depauperatus CBS 7841]